MSKNNVRVRPANLWRSLKQGFVETYRNLGTVVFSTIVSFLASAVVLMAAVYLAKVTGNTFVSVALLIPAAFVPWFCALGVFSYAGKTLMYDSPTAMDMLEETKRLFVPALKLFLANVIFLTVAVVDTLVLLGAAKDKGGVFFAALTALWVYLVAMWCLTAMYHLPMLIFESRNGNIPRARKVLWKSLLLAAGNPIFTLGLFLVIIAFALICALPGGVGWVALLLGTVAFLLSSALRELLISYGVIEEEPEVIEDKPWKTPDKRVDLSD